MQYKLFFTPKAALAFLSLLFICHESHELTHTTVAYFQCGCWGQRDFNVWQVCSTCPPSVNTVWATLAGPLFTYLLIWIGWWLMGKRNSAAQQSLGFALVWANVPFARLFTVLMKGGDEGVITRAITGQSQLPVMIWLLEVSVILLLVVPPFLRAWHLLRRQQKGWIFIAFLIGPMLLEFVVLHQLGNRLLHSGVLDQPGILGAPVLVRIWDAAWLMLLLVSFSSLFKLFDSARQHPSKKELAAQNF